MGDNFQIRKLKPVPARVRNQGEWFIMTVKEEKYFLIIDFSQINLFKLPLLGFKIKTSQNMYTFRTLI